MFVKNEMDKEDNNEDKIQKHQNRIRELYNEITYTTFYRNIDPEFMESKNDPWFDDNEYDMDRSFQNTIIQRFTTTSETKITDEMFSDFDAEYVHVFKYKTDEEEAISYWEAYYKINDDYSLFRKFDEYVREIYQ